MKEEEIKALLSAAKQLGINPNELKARNPFEFQGARAEAIQEIITRDNPSMAAQWRSDAGGSLSLGAVAARDGLTTMTQAHHQELLSLDPVYVAQSAEAQQRAEASLLDRMESESARLTEARTKRQESSARRARNPQQQNMSGQYAKEFIDRIGGIQNLNMPARKLIPGQ